MLILRLDIIHSFIESCFGNRFSERLFSFLGLNCLIIQRRLGITALFRFQKLFAGAQKATRGS